MVSSRHLEGRARREQLVKTIKDGVLLGSGVEGVLCEHAFISYKKEKEKGTAMIPLLCLDNITLQTTSCFKSITKSVVARVKFSQLPVHATHKC